jgi:5-methyltetrahydrofolate--homocysteine methyltransferase
VSNVSVLASAATTRCARRCTRSSCTTPSGPAWTWASSTPASSAVYEDIEPDLREAVEDVLLNRRPDATERLLEAAEQLKGRQAAKARRRRGGAAGRGAAQHALVQGHRRPHRRPTCRRGPAEVRAPARGHRGAADGRHERGRRPLRRGQDVPAPGGEERPRHEEGRGLPQPYIEAEKASGLPPEPGKVLLATVKGDVHDIGKNIVGVVLQLQRLRGHRPGRDGPARRSCDKAREKNVPM